MAFEEFQVYTAELTTGAVVRKGIAVDSEDLAESGPEFFFPPVSTITKGPIIRIEDFPGLDDVVHFE